VSEMNAALDQLSDETIAKMARAEQLENARTRAEWRERRATIEARRQDLAAQVQLGLRTVRSPQEILSGYAAEADVDQNTQRCRSVFEQWLGRGGQVEELKALLGHQAGLDRQRMSQQSDTLRRRVREAEGRLDARDRRIMELEGELATLRYRADRLEGAVGAAGW
jgi:chromosome segregation ATPase